MNSVTDSWARQLRAHGYRITAQRELILRAIHNLPHPNQESILEEVRTQAKDINRTTVYRTLVMLEEVGLVEHTHIGTDSPVYHLAGHRDHVHLVCKECQDVASVPGGIASAFAAELEELCGFRVDLSHTALTGLCETCRMASD
jgi:Fur family ferric uptake transcriptional regulator